MMSFVGEVFTEIPAVSVVFLGLWVFTMIMVPILRWWRGAGAERIGISLGVVFQTAAVVAVIVPLYGFPMNAIAIIGIPIAGWLVEFIGSRTGYPFGRYEYTPVLQPQIARVPVVIPAAWLMMLPAAWAVADALAPGESRIVFALIAAAAFVAWDLFLDPQMVRWNFWKWDHTGPYYDIPFTNFVGWFIVGFLLTLILAPAAAASRALVFVYAVTWILESIGQIVFWKLRLSGVVGFIAMGVLVLAAVL